MKNLFSFVFLLLLFSCDENAQKVNETQNNHKNEVQKVAYQAATLYQSVICSNNSNFSYAIYLPSNYTDTAVFPVVYFFDSQGVGAVPVEKYKNIADKLGIIICGSNNSKNGQNATEIMQIGQSFMEDIRNNFRVDTKQQFTGGFSGGARVAVQMANIDHQISGVAGFGAGIPNADFMNKINFNYFFAAGTSDFNFTELYNLDLSLNSLGKNHLFLTFEGKHEWPDMQTVEAGLYYLLIKSKASNSDSILKLYESFELETIKNARDNNDPLKELASYERKQIILSDKSSDKEIKTIKNKAVYKDHIKNLKIAMAKESNLKSAYSDMLNGGDINWWNAEIDKILKAEKESPIVEQKQFYARIRGYLGLVAYLYSNNALTNNQLPDAQKFLMIYEKVEPQNPEVHYLKAVFYARQQNHNGALLSLEEAVKNGFREFDRIRNESAFQFSEIEMDVIMNGKIQ